MGDVSYVTRICDLPHFLNMITLQKPLAHDSAQKPDKMHLFIDNAEL
jgi:hypothetical protein